MFDISFWELVVVGVVGLVVIGPDKLPEVARTLGKWAGRARRFVNQVKDDIDRELKQDELRKALQKEAGLDDIKEIMGTERFSLEEMIDGDKKPTPQVKAVPDEPKVNTTAGVSSNNDNAKPSA